MARLEVSGARLISFPEELVGALRKKRSEPSCWVVLVGLAVTLLEAATADTDRNTRNQRWGQNEIIWNCIPAFTATGFH